MSDTDDKTKPEDLRRSKRKKFHLDVVAVLSRRSPDFRRIGSKNESSNNLPFKPPAKRPYKSDVLTSAPVLEPMFPILDDDKSILKIEPMPVSNDNSTKDSNNSEENELEAPVEKRSKSDQFCIRDLDSQLGIKSEPVKPSPTKKIVCYKCSKKFRSNAGLGKHVKTCKKYVNAGRLSLPVLQSSSSSNSLSSLIKKESDGESLEDNSNELDDAMPILTPECSLKPQKNSKPITLNQEKRRLKRISAQATLQAPFDIKKALSLKLEIPPVPNIIVDSPVESHSDQIYCSKCPYKTGDRNLFKFHEVLHKDQKRNYQCTICSYSCLSPEALHHHLNLHAPALSPNTAIALRKHIIANKRNGVMHNNFTPSTSTMIQQMEQVQTQQQRLVSIIKRSNGDDHLNRKIRTRLPLPPTKFYCCRKCSFRVERKENLMFHEELHGSGFLYCCKHCDYASNARQVRDYHEKNHHFESSLTTHAINLTVNILKKKASELNHRSNSAPPDAEIKMEPNNDASINQSSTNDPESYHQTVDETAN